MELSPQKPLSQALLVTAGNLSVDLVTVEVVAALQQRSVASIVLKGPSISNWLYPNGDLRPYGDTDLLIAPNELPLAHELLLSLGFRYGFEPPGSGTPGPDGLPYLRAGMWVDIHSTLTGAEADPARVWVVLSGLTETQRVGALDVQVLAPPARAMHIALHAAQLGPGESKPLGDLARALETLPFELWKAAAEVAGQVEAIPSFAAGLRLLTTGEALAERLRLGKARSVKAVLRARTPPDLSLGFEELWTTRGFRAKVRFVARKVIPSAPYIRFLYPVARRGPVGLTLAYFRRIAWLLVHAPSGLRAWMQARRESR